MKKNILIVAICAVIAVVFTACPKPELTDEQLLTHSKGWVLSTATSVPAYENKDGVKSENLFVSFFDQCELDDILYFSKDGGSTMNFGKEICSWDNGTQMSLGNWRFVDATKEVLEFHLPYFFAANGINLALLEAKVVTLTDKEKGAETLQLRIPVEFTDDVTKGSNKILNTRGPKGAKGVDKFEFILTYKAK